MDKYDKLRLIDGLEVKYYFKGNYIVREGEEGDSFYIIEEGAVECLKNIEDDDFAGFMF